MTMFRRTIFTGFAPNLTKRDVLIALGFLFLPWRWWSLWRGEQAAAVETWLKQHFGISVVVPFDSGRSALTAALRALDVGPGADVLVQAYTCVVVINAIHAVGARPVFVDTTENFCMDARDARKKVTPRTKAILVQHTFGIPADIDALLSVAQEHRLKVIEDAAHTLGGKYKEKLLGTFGDAAILSFGSDKVVSCVRGGAAMTNDRETGERLMAIQKELPRMSLVTLLQHLLHGPVFFVSKPLYQFGIGKAMLWAAKALHLTARSVSEREKRGETDVGYPCQLPNALAAILARQLSEFEQTEVHRKHLGETYTQRINNPLVHLPCDIRSTVQYAYLRYPLLTDHPKHLCDAAKKRGIILGDWYDRVVTPCAGTCAHAGYADGACPHAEADTRGSVNLPTDRRITDNDAERIIAFLNAYTRVDLL